MKSFSTKYIIIAIFSLIILSTVQFFLLFNTYRIESEHFSSKEKELINNDYSQMIVNDKIYPGGSKIIDSIFNLNVNKLDSSYHQNRAEFGLQCRQMMFSILSQLKQHNNLDSLLEEIIKQKHHLKEKYRYALLVKKFEIAFRKNNYIQIFPNPEINNNTYCVIGGTLPHPSTYNMVTGLSISSPTDKSYRILFALHLENNNKELIILKKMMPTFLLSFCSITSIVFLFFITFNNWIKQKKLAEMQSDFINSITHEFNTPLTAIMVANKSLQNDKLVEQNNKIKQLTSIIQRQADRLTTLFKQVLGITVFNATQLQKKNYNFPELIEEIISDYRLKLQDQSTQLIFEPPKNNYTVELDKFWFTTMLQNIIDNGIKYNREKQKIIRLSLEAKENNLCLSIEDNGIGMTKQTSRHIFEKFYRNREGNIIAGGLGLGLFYVSQCILMHQWEINIDSEVGSGTIFTILIPGKYE